GKRRWDEVCTTAAGAAARRIRWSPPSQDGCIRQWCAPAGKAPVHDVPRSPTTYLTMKLLHPRTAAFFKDFATAYPGRTALMVVLQALSGLLEGLGVVALVPLLEGASNRGATAGIGAAAQDAVRSVGLEPTLPVVLRVVVVALKVNAVFLALAMRQ